MSKKTHPKTNAIRCLEQHGIPFEVFSYAYEESGGTRASFQAVGVDEHCVIKTLIMETNTKTPVIVLMHGDREASTKQLAIPHAERLLVCSSYQSRYDLDMYGPSEQVVPCTSWTEVMIQLLKKYPDKAKVAVYPYAAIQYPAEG